MLVLGDESGRVGRKVECEGTGEMGTDSQLRVLAGAAGTEKREGCFSELVTMRGRSITIRARAWDPF